MIARLTAALLLGCGLAGCTTPGFLYTDITLPLTLDMQETPRASAIAQGSLRTIREPVTRIGVRAEWSGYAPGQAAQRAGMDVMLYADIRRQSVLGGIFGRTTVLVYGVELAGADAAQADAPAADAGPP